jgi:hypothetical protein
VRRRRKGVRAVAGAVEEVRDRLRAYGVPVSTGMTPRDLAAVAPAGAADGLLRLSAVVNRALWSGAAPPDAAAQAWTAVRDVRRGLAAGGWRTRVRAVFGPRALR